MPVGRKVSTTTEEIIHLIMISEKEKHPSKYVNQNQGRKLCLPDGFGSSFFN